MTDRTPAAQTSEPQTANWDEFACDGLKCGCHDPFICSTCGCTHNEAEAAAAPAGLDVERLQRAILRVRRSLWDQGMEPEIQANDADALAAAYAEGEQE